MLRIRSECRQNKALCAGRGCIVPYFMIRISTGSEGCGITTQETARNKEQIQFLSLSNLVQREHLVRKLEAELDWSFINDMVSRFSMCRRFHFSIDCFSKCNPLPFRVDYKYCLRKASYRETRAFHLLQIWRLSAYCYLSDLIMLKHKSPKNRSYCVWKVMKGARDDD